MQRALSGTDFVLSREHLLLITTQPAILSIIWARLRECSSAVYCVSQMGFLYALYASLAFLVLVLSACSAWRLRSWGFLQRAFSVDSMLELASLQRSSINRFKCDLKEHSENAIQLRSRKAQQTIDELSRRHLFFRNQNKELALQNDRLCTAICSIRDASARQQRQLNLCRALVLGFFQWARLSCKRIRSLSFQTHDLQHRLSTSVSAHLELRRHHITLSETYTASQKRALSLQGELDTERRCHLSLKAQMKQASIDLSTSREKCTSLQQSMDMVVGQYEELQESFSQLLFAQSQFKGDCGKLRGDLKQAFQLVQATQDVAQLGLSTMADPATARPLKVKQDFMRIAQLLDLVRLNVADTVTSLGSLIGGEDQPQMTIQSPTLPGSVDDNVRKLKIICGISRDGDDDGLDSSHVNISDSHTSPSAIKRLIESVSENTMNNSFMSDFSFSSDVSDQTKINVGGKSLFKKSSRNSLIVPSLSPRSRRVSDSS